MEYMKANVAALIECDLICLVPGWTASRGAKLEAHIAEQLGITRLEI